MKHIDTHELAWAAGFFDGEGSISLTGRKGGRPEIRLAVPQSEPRSLERFQRAVGGLGTLAGPYTREIGGKRYLPRYVLAAHSLIAVQAIVAMLWNWLSEPKRQQFIRAMAAVVPYQLERFERGAKGVARLTLAQAQALREEHAKLSEGRTRAPRGSRAALAHKYGLKVNTLAAICGGHGYGG